VETHLIERVINPQPFAPGPGPQGATWAWYTESDEKFTYIYANFHDKDPNRELVEINVRDACFYPDSRARLHHGPRFEMSQAATQWPLPPPSRSA